MPRDVQMSPVEMRVLYNTFKDELSAAATRYAKNKSVDMEQIRDLHVGYLEVAKKWMDQRNAAMFTYYVGTIRRTMKVMNGSVEAGHFNLDAKRLSAV